MACALFEKSVSIIAPDPPLKECHINIEPSEKKNHSISVTFCVVKVMRPRVETHIYYIN